MDRDKAILKLEKLKGQDLRLLADKFGVTVWKSGKLNKGWAGHVIERYLDLPLNSSQTPNFGSWELKIIPLKKDKYGEYVVKETMAITMIDPYDIKRKDFLHSHLYLKLQKAVICAREFISKSEETSKLIKVSIFNLDNPEILKQINADYEEARDTVINFGFDALSGRMGVLVQPRTKGPGHGSTSRAFYARKIFLEYVFGMRDSI